MPAARQVLLQETPRKVRAGTTGTPPPRGISTIDPGRSTGSRELDPPPSQVPSTQWPGVRNSISGPTLAYRCGGSTGLETQDQVSRLKEQGKSRSSLNLAPCTLHLLFAPISRLIRRGKRGRTPGIACRRVFTYG